MIDAFTDYPFADLGDTPGELAPIRSCKVLTYDHNKYCDILVIFEDSDGDVRGYLSSVKAGYIYKNEARYENGENLTSEELYSLPWRKL